MKLSKTSLRRTQDERITELERADPTLMSSRQDFAREIQSLWDDARDRVLRIGKMLVMAKATLGHGEYEQMIEQDLPFARGVAFQIRSVYESIQSGQFTAEELPAPYSIAYQLVSLKDPEKLEQARAEGLVRPDVRRSEILEIKRRLSSSETTRAVSPERIRALKADRQKLLEKLRALEAELQDLGADPETLNEDNDEVIEGEAVEV
jgi:hypothetical protein